VDASSTIFGEVRLRGLGDITLVNVDTVDGLIDVQAAGTITVASDPLQRFVVSAGGTGTVTLDANGNTSDIVINDGVRSGRGDIVMLADRNISLNGAAANVLTSHDGDIALWADAEGSGRGALILNGGDVVAGTVGDGNLGNIYLRGYSVYIGPGSEVRTVSDGGGVAIVSGSSLSINAAASVIADQIAMQARDGIVLDTALAADLVLIESTAGSIGGVGSVSAGQVGFSAAGDIGGATDPMNVAAVTLAAVAGGSIFLAIEGDTTVGDVTAPDLAWQVPAGAAGILPVFADVSGIDAGQDVILTVNGVLGGNFINAGGLADITVGEVDGLAELDAGSILLDVAGAYVGGSMISAGDIVARMASLTLSGSMVAGGDVNAVVGGDFDVAAIEVGGDGTLADVDARFDVAGNVNFGSLVLANGVLDLEADGSVAFNTITAPAVDMSAGANITVGAITCSGGASLTAGGTINDNAADDATDITAATISLHAGTGIGSDANGSIDLDVGAIGEIVTAAGNISVRQNRSGLTPVGLIAAPAGSVTITIPYGGMRDGDTGSDGVDIVSGGDLHLTVADEMGEFVTGSTGADNPMEVSVGGDITFEAPAGVTSLDADGMLWAYLDSTPRFNNRIQAVDNRWLGLVVVGNRVAGDADLLNRLYRTQAFVIETPELKSKQGIFGSPIFLHNYMTIGETMELGTAEYLVFGDVEVTQDGSFPKEVEGVISAPRQFEQ
jgi:hypothetical protein